MEARRGARDRSRSQSRGPRARAVGRRPLRAPDRAPVHYERHRPEQTSPYCLAQQHATTYIAETEVASEADLRQSQETSSTSSASTKQQTQVAVATFRLRRSQALYAQTFKAMSASSA